MTVLHLVFVFASISIAGGPCDQDMYDRIYKAIIVNALDSKLTQKDVDLKNKTIENLRILCHDQLSTYEKGKNR